MSNYAEPWRDPSAKREADADNEHATRVLIRKLKESKDQS